MALFRKDCILEALAVLHMQDKEYLLTPHKVLACLEHKLDMGPQRVADLVKELVDSVLVGEVLEELLF